jgi:ABC-2 type transport system permease protein
MLVEPLKIYAVWLRETKRFLNSRSRIVGSLGMPFFFLIALGIGFGSLMPGFNYQVFIAPGIIGMTLLFNSMFSGVSIIWDREFGFLKEMLVAPTSRINIVVGRVLGGATTAIIQGSIIMVLALFVGMPFPGVPSMLAAVFVMLLISSTFVALGVAFASVIREVETFQLIMNFIIMPIFFMSNALFPLDKMPSWMQSVANLNPLTYGVDALRNLLLGSSSHPLTTDLALLLVLPLIVIAVATLLFERTSI